MRLSTGNFSVENKTDNNPTPIRISNDDTSPARDVSILFCDRNLIVLNKPYGIPVVPGRGIDGSLCLKSIVEKMINDELFTVHRIDIDTSGAVVFCRNAETHRLLSLQFENRKVNKEYSALVLGIVKGEGIIEKPIFRFGSGRMGVDPRGKLSQTVYRVQETFDNATLLKIKPITGRRHQIRVHLYSIGHPVLGDRLYGTNRPVGGIERLMLHAESISFYYPSDQLFSVSAPYDETWISVLNRYRTDSKAAGSDLKTQ